MQHIRSAIAVGILALLVPVTLRVAFSPWTLFILSPFIILGIVISFLLCQTIIGHYLDIQRTRPKHTLASTARPLAFSTPAAWQAVLTRSQWAHSSSQSLPPLCPDMPIVSENLNDILGFIIRDFVLVWYNGISSSQSFPAAVSTTIHASISRLLDRAGAIDMPTLLVKRVLPKVTAHIEQFRQSEVELRGARLERKLTESEELDLLLASRYTGKGGRLHPAVDNLSSTFTKQTEEQHLRKLVDLALPLLLPEPECDSIALKIIAREIVACVILPTIMDMIADPDFWNKAIDDVVSLLNRYFFF